MNFSEKKKKIVSLHFVFCFMIVFVNNISNSAIDEEISIFKKAKDCKSKNFESKQTL